jgi:hypothetical protein
VVDACERTKSGRESEGSPDNGQNGWAVFSSMGVIIMMTVMMKKKKKRRKKKRRKKDE